MSASDERCEMWAYVCGVLSRHLTPEAWDTIERRLPAYEISSPAAAEVLRDLIAAERGRSDPKEAA